MSKCIQPACSCTGYKEPAQSKSTLLQFRLSCQECGHQASEHRKLTAVDQYIKSQVSAAKKSRCSTFILPSEIPLCPVFSTYDLIPIPRDDCIPSTESSVQCTCRGFQTSDLIRLCQNFRTHSLGDVSTELIATPCSFCAHPLSSHAPLEQDGRKEYSNALFANMRPSLGLYESLALRDSTSLPSPPINQNCQELITPTSLTGTFSLVWIEKSKDPVNARLAIASHMIDVRDTEVKDGVVMSGGNNLPSSDVASSCEDLRSGALIGKRTRRRCPASPPPRRSGVRSSVRLATKKLRQEERKVLRSLKGLKGAGKLREVDLTRGDDAMEVGGASEGEQRRLVEYTASFLSGLETGDSYQSFPLPKELSGIDNHHHLLMAACRLCEDSPGQGTKQPPPPPPQRVLVAVGVREGAGVFLAMASSSGQGTWVCSEWQHMVCSDQGRLECLMLKEGLKEGPGPCGEVLLCVGLSSGLVRVWKVVLTQDRVDDTIPLISFRCPTQCLSVSCSVRTMFVSAGTLTGDVVFCGLPTGEDAGTETAQPPESVQPALQTLSCCAAPIRCFAWSEDGRLLAVGACDDCVQVLQCGELPRLDPPTTSKGSLLSYFKRTRSTRLPKFLHTYTLKGHTSFIADLLFTPDGLLSSLGWDGQLLCWGRLEHRATTTTTTRHHHHKGRADRAGLEAEFLDPVGGYKIGPSLAVEFLPVMLRPVMGYGLLVAMVNKTGGTTLASYVKQSLL